MKTSNYLKINFISNMKQCINIFILLIMPFNIFCQKEEAKEIVYITNAVKLAAKENKTLIIEFWAPTCGPCIRLKRDIFENEKTKEFIDKNFLVFKVSPADSIYNALWKHYYLVYQSTIIYFNKNGNEIDRTVSYDGNKNAYLSFMKDVSEGKNLYKDIFELYHKDTLNAFNNYLLAKKLLSRNEMKNAIILFNRALLYAKDDTSGFYQECKYKIAECEYILNGNIDKLKEYIKTEANNDFVPKAYEYLLSDYINKKDKNNCLIFCDEAINKYPESWEVLNKYAWIIFVFKIKDDYEKALKMAQKSISLNPDRAGTYSTEASLYFEMGNKEKAIESIKKAIEIYPHSFYKEELERFMK